MENVSLHSFTISHSAPHTGIVTKWRGGGSSEQVSEDLYIV